MAAATDRHECHVCNKPASLLCKHTEPNGSTITTAYCSKACRKKDWPKYKDDCHDSQHRRQLYQAGKLLHDVFYLFRRKMFEQPVAVAKTDDGKLQTHSGVRSKDDVVWEYPNFAGLTDEDHAALLTANTCTHPHRFFTSLIEDTLAGCVESITELTVYVHKTLKRVDDQAIPKPSYLREASESCIHDLFLVKLKDQQDYVLDLAGAQFGQMRPVLSFAEYQATYIDPTRETTTNPLGVLRQHMKEPDLADFSLDQRPTAIYGLLARYTTADLGGTVLQTYAKQAAEAFEISRAKIHDSLMKAINGEIEAMGGYKSLYRHDMFRDGGISCLKRLGLIL